MIGPRDLVLALIGMAVGVGVARAQAAGAAPVDFIKDVRPILSDACFHCHGPDPAQRKGKFRLDLKEEVFRAGKSGKTPIVAGRPAESELIARILSKDPDEVMPPPDAKTQLKPEQVETLKRWVESGAEYRGHWAFVPPQRPTPPKVEDAGWSNNPIDQFVVVRLLRRCG